MQMKNGRIHPESLVDDASQGWIIYDIRKLAVSKFIKEKCADLGFNLE